jgi:protein-arginine kinase
MSGVTQVSKDIPMAHDERLGFVTCSPVNLGNTIRVSVRMELEKLPLKKDKLDEMLKAHKMKIRKCSVEESGDFENLHELSSERCMGVTEFQTVNEVGEAIIELIEAEKAL